ncbi:Uncharacterised protein [Cedecea lapagei]|uniref:Uncharacterized protein n=1 Tax=Cedecea lapagei TaxID=158823 RepID=A0A3S4J4S5_9ENTR|nr:hypothetical protein [Cedecea lapagei]VEC00514.1 Uncharacterised protein [Cedecea lapagei]
MMDDMSDTKRLRLLENAVVNYSGGITSLEKRIVTVLEKDKTLCENTKLLLEDIAMYMRDMKTFVRLDT